MQTTAKRKREQRRFAADEYEVDEGGSDDEDFVVGDDVADEEDDYLDDEEAGTSAAASASVASAGGGARRRGRGGGRGGAARSAAVAAQRRQRQRRQAGGGTGRRSLRDDEDAEEFDLDDAYESDGEGGTAVGYRGVFRLGEQDDAFHDYSGMQLKPDHQNRPLWACPDGRIFLETFSPVYRQAYDFLIAIAEPVSRPESIHEYVLTPHSLYAAVSIGLETPTIIAVLNRLSKTALPKEVKDFVRASTENYGKVKLVLQRNKFFVESPYPDILKKLLKDSVIRGARVESSEEAGVGKGSGGAFLVSHALKDRAVADLAAVEQVDLTRDEDESDTITNATGASGPGGAVGQAAIVQAGAGAAGDGVPAPQPKPSFMQDATEADPDKELHSFQIDPAKVEHVKQRLLPGALNYPMLEEYDFRNDTSNPDLAIDLKPTVTHRPYQEKSLSKMFGNGRARSGIIVLPCGAGKTLVGVSAAARIKKSCLVLCTNSVSVDQWKYQFTMWTGLQEHQVCRFTSDRHEWFQEGTDSGVAITTFTMIAYSGKRSAESERIMQTFALLRLVMQEIMSREWGLLLLDEVHVVPAQMFRKVIGIVKAHCKLGLTATLVREDQLITDLNFLIGPKLYEANWLDLTRAGHIANVQCAEVWCPMTREFSREYLRPSNASRKQLLYVMNPTKFQACQFLVDYHERVRGDKVIVFSDNIYALKEYAVRMHKAFIYGGTGHQERTRILHAFKHNEKVNTVFLSKVGDNSLDIPEANVLIQISSHAGSRRQEAQRLGRILRAKKAKPGSAPSAEEFNAFFYTLVSNDTQEVYFTNKRQQFLIDQGYSYKVLANILEQADRDRLLLSKKEEQLDVLAKILSSTEAEAQGAEEKDDLRDDVGVARRRPIAKRRTGDIAALTGGAGLTYMEYSTKGRGQGGAQQAQQGGQGRGGGRGWQGSQARPKKAPGKLAKLRKN
ncbi:hypothetical protein N2152v2_005222 [Parachlorella kessleri]